MKERETHPTPEAAAADMSQCPLCAGRVKRPARRHMRRSDD